MVFNPDQERLYQKKYMFSKTYINQLMQMFWISVISQYYMTILKTKQGPKGSKFTEALKTCAFDTELFYILKFAKSVTYLNIYISVCMYTLIYWIQCM